MSICTRGVTIPALDPALESDFNSFGNSEEFIFGSRSRKKWIRNNSYRGVIIPSQDPDPELDSEPFGYSDSLSGSRKTPLVATSKRAAWRSCRTKKDQRGRKEGASKKEASERWRFRLWTTFRALLQSPRVGG